MIPKESINSRTEMHDDGEVAQVVYRSTPADVNFPGELQDVRCDTGRRWYGQCAG